LRLLIKAHAQGIITTSNYDQEKIINQVIVGKCKWRPTRIGKPRSLLSLVFGIGFWCVRIQRGLNHVYKILGPLEACSRSCVWNLCWVILWFHVGWTFIKFKISIVFYLGGFWSMWRRVVLLKLLKVWVPLNLIWRDGVGLKDVIVFICCDYLGC
jgi:hypothetical protein